MDSLKLTTQFALDAIRPDKIDKTSSEYLAMIHGFFKSIANGALEELKKRNLDEDVKAIRAFSDGTDFCDQTGWAD